MKNTTKAIWTSVFAVLLFAGCASVPAPMARLASAKAAIRLANEVGAVDTPSAALHLRLARDQFVLAEKLIRRDENERAALILMRAEADAELAVALAREERLRNEAMRASQAVRSQAQSSR